MRAFRPAFARLQPAYREVLVLYAVHGLRYEEIAAACGCAVGTVKSRTNRARAVLKAMLLGEGAARTAPAGGSTRATWPTLAVPPRRVRSAWLARGRHYRARWVTAAAGGLLAAALIGSALAEPEATREPVDYQE